MHVNGFQIKSKKKSRLSHLDLGRPPIKYLFLLADVLLHVGRFLAKIGERQVAFVEIGGEVGDLLLELFDLVAVRLGQV